MVEGWFVRALACWVIGACGAFGAAAALGPSPQVGASPMVGTTASWCTSNGANVVGWTGTSPDIPICGPAPNDGGTWQYVTIPGPYGSTGYFFNATTGFQCVELAERFLSVADGLAPVLANGQQVAENYHSAYPNTSLYVNGSPRATAHAPVSGDVISFSNAPGFDAYTDGHVAIVSSSSVDEKTGTGSVMVAQENVGAGYNLYRISLQHWRLVDPNSPPDALFGFAYAEWLHVKPYRLAVGLARTSLLATNNTGMVEPVQGIVANLSSGLGFDVRVLRHAHTRRR